MIIIFDVDDTLVHTHKKAYEKTLRTANKFGLDISFKVFSEAYGKMDFYSCVRHWFSNVDVDKFRERYNSIRYQYPYESIGNILNLLSKIAKKHKIGIITNSSSQGTDYKLNCMGFPQKNRDIFDFIYHKHNMIAPKPNSSQIEKICSEGYAQNEMIYIGDNVRDYEFTLNAGIKFYAVLTGLDTSDMFLKKGLNSDQILKNVHEINKIC